MKSEDEGANHTLGFSSIRVPSVAKFLHRIALAHFVENLYTVVWVYVSPG